MRLRGKLFTFEEFCFIAKEEKDEDFNMKKWDFSDILRRGGGEEEEREQSSTTFA